MDRLIHLSNIEISKLDISDQIVIAAVMVSLKENKQRFSLEELVTSHFSPTTELNIRLIEHLIALELVMICNINKKSEYTYKLKVLNDEPTLKLLFNSIKESNYSDNPLIKNLIFEVLSAECIEYVTVQLRRRGHSINLNSKPPTTLSMLLSERTSSEIHMLLWQALTNLSDTYSRMTMVSESHSKLIDRIMDDAWTHHERYKRLNREVKVFNRSPSFKRSIINEILFSMHLTFDEEYFTEIIF